MTSHKNKIYLGAKKTSDLAELMALWLCTLYTFIVVVIVIIEVFLRATGATIYWSEEFSRWLLIGISYVGASVALKRGYHVAINLIIDVCPRLMKYLLIFAGQILVTSFLLYLVYFGYMAAKNSLNQSGDTIPFSMFYVKFHLTIGAVLMIVHMLYFMIGLFFTKNPQDYKMSNM